MGHLLGSPEEAELLAQRMSATHCAMCGPGPSPHTGGLITWVSNEWSVGAEVRSHNALPGRVLLVVVDHPRCGRLAIANIHIVDIPSATIGMLRDWVVHERDVRRAMVVLTGDWNFEEAEHAVSDETPGQPRRNKARDAVERRRWETVLRHCTAHDPGVPTLYADELAAGESVRATALDRTYSALRPHELAMLRVCCVVGAVGTATSQRSRRSVSDHAAVRTSFHRLGGMPPHRWPIPDWVCRDSRFRDSASAALRELRPERLHPADAWRHAKQVVRVVAAGVWGEILAANEKSPDAQRQLALQLLRAVHRGEFAHAGAC